MRKATSNTKRTTRAPRALAAIAALACAGFIAAPAQAGGELKDAFEDQMGRLLAVEAFHTGKWILSAGHYGPYATHDHHYGDRYSKHRRGDHYDRHYDRHDDRHYDRRHHHRHHSHARHHAKRHHRKWHRKHRHFHYEDRPCNIETHVIHRDHRGHVEYERHERRSRDERYARW